MDENHSESELLKVGQLASVTGLSVRTLHHYDEIGLLSPSTRTRAGHRLYGRDEVERLQQIASLRQLGLPLDEIRRCLGRSGFGLKAVLALHVERLRTDIREKERLCGQLEELHARVQEGALVSLADLARTVERTIALERYYSSEQLEQLAQRRDEVGQDRMVEAQAEWQSLFAAFGDAMEADLDPAHPDVAALARRSAALIEEFTGGDEGIRNSLGQMYAQEGADKVMSGQGMHMPPGLWEYMARASAALREEEA